jgi:hypothetical protein
MKVETDGNTGDTRVLDRFRSPEDNNHRSCVLMYYDMLGSRPPLPLLL